MSAVARFQGPKAESLELEYIGELVKAGGITEKSVFTTEVNGKIHVWKGREDGGLFIEKNDGTIAELPSTKDIDDLRESLLKKLTENQEIDVFAYSSTRGEGSTIIGSSGGETF